MDLGLNSLLWDLFFSRCSDSVCCPLRTSLPHSCPRKHRGLRASKVISSHLVWAARLLDCQSRGDPKSPGLASNYWWFPLQPWLRTLSRFLTRSEMLLFNNRQNTLTSICLVFFHFQSVSDPVYSNKDTLCCHLNADIAFTITVCYSIVHKMNDHVLHSCFSQ